MSCLCDFGETMQDLTKRSEVFHDVGLAIGVLKGILLRVEPDEREWIKIAISKLEGVAEYLKSVEHK
jgi:hypothetical protein